MAFRVQNPYYNDAANSLGDLVGGLISGIGYDPEKDPKAQQAKYYGAETAKLDRAAQGQRELGDVIAQLGGPDNIKDAAGRAYGIAARYGLDPKAVSSYVLGYAANSGGTNDTVARAAVGATGQGYGKDIAFTEDKQTSIRRENEEADRNLEGMRQSGMDRRQGMADAAAMERTKFTTQKTPVNTPANTTTTFAPDDPRANGPRIQGTPSREAAMGAVYQKVMTNQPLNDGEMAIFLGSEPNLIKGYKLDPKAVGEITFMAAQGINGAIKTDGSGNATVDPDLFKAIPAERLAAANRAAAATYGRTQDPAASADAWRQAAGIKDGATFNKPMLGRNGFVDSAGGAIDFSKLPAPQVADPAAGAPSTGDLVASIARRGVPSAAGPVTLPLTGDIVQPGAGGGAQQQPTQAAPAIARPPSVPPGSQYSPSRQMWRDPSGKLYDAQGRQVG